MAFSGNRGEFAAPQCSSEPPSSNPYYARQVTQYRRTKSRNASRSTALSPVALHLGDAVSPGAFGRYLLRQGSQGGRRLASLLDNIPFAAVGLGANELSLTESELDAFTRGASEVGLPLQAVNLECTSPRMRDLLCDRIGDRFSSLHRLERDGIEIGVLSVLDPSIADDDSVQFPSGVAIADPDQTTRGLLDQLAPEQRPDVLIAQYRGTDSTSIRAPLRLARNVEGIDLVLTGRQLPWEGGEAESKKYDYMVTPGTESYVYSVPDDPRQATFAQLEVSRSSKAGWQLTDIETQQTEPAQPDPEVASTLAERSRELCDAWGNPLVSPSSLDEPFSRPNFITFALNTVRFSTHTEIALADDGIFREDTIFPIEDTLTLADLYTAIPGPTSFVTVEVPGSKLRELKSALGTSIHASGMSVSDGSVDINGRPVVSDRTYSVAMNRRLAAGSGGPISVGAGRDVSPYRPIWSDGTPDFSAIVIHHLETNRFRRRLRKKDAKLSPNASFPNLHRQPLWTLVGSLTASYNRVSVNNPNNQGEPGYDRSQLKVKQTDQINADGTFEVNGDSRNHGWDNKLRLKYATSRIGENSKSFEESEDMIRGRTRYKYAGFRADAGGARWVPKPTVEAQVESEFSPGVPTDADARSWRKLEFTGIAGATFQLFEPFELKVGFNTRGDVNDPNGRTTAGLTVAYALARTDIASVMESPLKFESDAEYFYNDPGGQKIQELRANARLYYSLLDELYFSTSFSAFAFKTKNVGPFGINTEVTFGINYFWKHAIQSF